MYITRSVKASFLVTILLDLWGWGRLSANEVQRIAHGACADREQHAEVQQLGALGCAGLYPGNARRDLITQFGKQISLPKPTAFPVSVLNHKNEDIEIQHSRLSQFLLVNAMQKVQPAQFEKHIVHMRPRDFWIFCFEIQNQTQNKK